MLNFYSNYCSIIWGFWQYPFSKFFYISIWASISHLGAVVTNQFEWVKCAGDMFTEEQNELIESAAEMLYGLIHARYILTSKGMAAMVRIFFWVMFYFYAYNASGQNNPLWSSQLDKFKNYDFGRCPRVYCCGQPCLPVGQSDIPRASTVKIYCPRCEDVYYPRSKYQGSILYLHDHLFNYFHAHYTFLINLLLQSSNFFCEISHQLERRTKHSL